MRRLPLASSNTRFFDLKRVVVDEAVVCMSSHEVSGGDEIFLLGIGRHGGSDQA